MDNSELLISTANNYLAGDKDLSKDEADFWLWEQHNRLQDFVVEHEDSSVECLNPKDIWYMEPSVAKTCHVIGITGSCIECQYADRCKKAEIATSITKDKQEEI
jgi:predicted amino acid dehydrogenase